MAAIYNYNQLFSINITLNGNNPTAFGAYTVMPVGPTATALNCAGLLRWRRPGDTSFGVWYDAVTSPAGFNSSLHLYFLLQVTDPSFYDDVDLQMQQQPMVAPSWKEKQNPPLNTPLALNYYFLANHDKDLQIKTSNSLQTGALVGPGDLQVDTKFYIDNKIDSFTSTAWMPFGLISIIWNADAWGNAVGTVNGTKIYKPPNYQINFPIV